MKKEKEADVSDLKQALLEGSLYRESVTLVKPNGDEIEVEVRPLTSKEAAEVTALAQKGLKAPLDNSGKVQIDVELSQIQNQMWQSNVRAASLGLSHDGDDWTDDEVGQLRPDWVEQIARTVRRISGVQGLDDDESFRSGGGEAGSRGRYGSSGSEPVGDSAGEDAG